MLTATGLEVRAGAALLLESASFRIGPGDRVGLVGRNGAGKTTLTRILAGEAQPAAGQGTRTRSGGHLPQGNRTGGRGAAALAGGAHPAGGQVTRPGGVGYLPQDNRTGDLDVAARERILSARGLHDVVRRLREAEQQRGGAAPGGPDRAH